MPWRVDAHETYKKAIEKFKAEVFLGPTPQAREGVTAVEAAMAPPQPGLGGIVQGVFSGQVKDVRAALQKLSDSQTKSGARRRSRRSGVPRRWSPGRSRTWKPGEDFGPERYLA